MKTGMMRGFTVDGKKKPCRLPLYLMRTPHPVIVIIGDNRDYTRVLLYSFYTTLTGRGVLLTYTLCTRVVGSLGTQASQIVASSFSQDALQPVSLGVPGFRGLVLYKV